MTDKIDSVNKGLQDFIFISKYARWLPKQGRRESWEEAVDRVCNSHLQKYDYLSKEDKDAIRHAFTFVKDKKVLPSMRSMQFAGPAVFAHEARGYNCSVRHIDSIRAFAEIGYLMLCGCGTGIGLTERYLSRLPNLVGPDNRTGSVITYTIDDNIEGWADSIEALLMCYFQNTAMSGRKIIFDYSKIRRKGAILKTGGGRAPGYKPLKAAHLRIKKLLDRLIEEEHVSVIRPIHAYDIMMHFADAVLSGGVRRTASSVVFNAADEEMINAKTFFKVYKHQSFFDDDTNMYHCRVRVGKHWHTVDLPTYDYEKMIESKQISWFYIEPQRARSNNSALLIRSTTTQEQFNAIVEKTKQFGEPGFVWANNEDVLFNPCYEIGFVPVTERGECGVQFCNLTTQNGDKINSAEDLIEFTRIAAIIGTLQAGYTNFKYLSKVCKQLTEEEALLGISITGILSSPEIILDESNLRKATKVAEETNRLWAAKLGINPAARLTAIKPEGTGSLVMGVQAPGIHGAHAEFYLKRVQTTKGDPHYEYFKLLNPHMCEESVWSANKTDDVITFPIKAKQGAILKDSISALEHLEIIKKVQKNWVLTGGANNKKDVTNNVSCTVLVKPDEWEDVVKYIYENREYFSAVSLLDHMGDKTYQQAPFEKVNTQENFYKYKDLMDKYAPVDFSHVMESSDDTTHTAEMACAGGACVI